MRQLLVEHICAGRAVRGQTAGRVVQPFGADERAVVHHHHRTLNAVRAELAQLLVQRLAFLMRGHLDHEEVLAAAAREAGALFQGHHWSCSSRSPRSPSSWRVAQ